MHYNANASATLKSNSSFTFSYIQRTMNFGDQCTSYCITFAVSITGPYRHTDKVNSFLFCNNTHKTKVQYCHLSVLFTSQTKSHGVWRLK